MKEDSFAKYSLASKARQARYTPEERSAKMKAIALKKWSMISAEERRVHSLKMVQARLIKKQNVKIEEGSERRDLPGVAGTDSSSTSGSNIDASNTVASAVAGV